MARQDVYLTGNATTKLSIDANKLKNDITKLHSYEDNLKSDMTEIQSEVNKNDSEESNEEEP